MMIKLIESATLANGQVLSAGVILETSDDLAESLLTQGSALLYGQDESTEAPTEAPVKPVRKTTKESA